MIGIDNKDNGLTKVMSETAEKLVEYKTSCEANIISIIYKENEKLYDSDLKLNDFSNNTWRVYFEIACGILEDEKKETIDELTVGFYLKKHDKLRNVYEENGGYNVLKELGTYGHVENFDGYVAELKKWNCLLMLLKNGFPIWKRLSDYVDMPAEYIYAELEATFNDVFIRIDSNIKSYNAADGLRALVDEMEEGREVGLPFSNAHLLDEETGGWHMGHIYGLGASSGTGKTATMINYILPSIFSNDEKVVMIINEEDQDKVKRELLVWTVNNIFNGYKDENGSKKLLQKKDIRDGHFSGNIKDALYTAADYIGEKKDNRNVTIIPLERYTVNNAIKIIKKYASMGVKYFIIDTFKEGADIGANEQTWKVMERDMRKLYDVIKPSSKNVALFTTYQLGKDSIRTRRLSNSNIGQSKNILDVMSCNIMMRRPMEDEFEGGSKELSCYKFEGKNGRTKVGFKLKNDKSVSYMLTFITKNRFGKSDDYQIVSEFDLSTNTHKDIGICYVPQDF